MASLLETFSPRKKRPAPTRPPLLPWEQKLLDHPRVPVVVPPQTPQVERDDPSLDDLETKVPRAAIFPSRGIDIDALYETEVRACVRECVAPWLDCSVGRLPFLDQHHT